MSVRGIRGAITVTVNEEAPILRATRELLETMVTQNSILPEDVAGVFVTMSPDLNATFPAKAIRTLPGWAAVPLMCSTEVDVPGSLARCIRLMVLVNTDRESTAIQHVYLGEARRLRPDLAEDSGG